MKIHSQSWYQSKIPTLLAHLCKQILLNFCSLKELLPQLVGCIAAWYTVERLFTSQSRASVMQFKLQLQTLKKSSSLMTEYLIKKKSILDALAYSVPEITAFLMTYEARIEQHTHTEVVSVNMASNNQGLTGVQSGQGSGILDRFLVVSLMNRITIKEEAVVIRMVVEEEEEEEEEGITIAIGRQSAKSVAG
ncbi:hypothetical protein Dsin_005019 [Dipteronia sinensis]|uniref:Uncharacterized protein n=1 Tax=Dipteronia sinensis TaxID=43782 RepID=A0AAE0EES6_9ROSI|nr:hypothetical protein Dsin_005019 [Dipteronia sinensis]